jgi:hypothetical protein
MIEITDEKTKGKINFLLNNLWSGKFAGVFPHQTCNNIERKNLFKLKSFLYCFYKKNTKNEKRALLFLFTDSNSDKTSVLILKDGTIYSLNLHCNLDYYKNSLFDVSIIDNKIVIYDSLYTSGNKTSTYTFVERINAAEIFVGDLILNENMIVTVCDYKQNINSLSNSIIPFEDEIFMISNNLPIVVGENRGCFKWQPSKFIYFSLKVIENNEDLLLYACNYKKDVLFSKIDYSDSSGLEYINKIKGLDNYKNECVIDIGINENENEILIIRVSENFPTSVRYIEKLLCAKKENITLEELF